MTHPLIFGNPRLKLYANYKLKLFNYQGER